MRMWCVLFLSVGVMLLYGSSCFADNNGDGGLESQLSHEVRVFANSLKYFEGIKKNSDVYQVGVVYSPAIGHSLNAAKEYASAMNASGDASKYGLSAKVISVEEIKGSGVGIIYVVPDISSAYPMIYSAAKSAGIFVYGHDAECVWQKLCVMAIKIEYTLEISLSDAAIKNYGFRVDPMLRLLVKRLER